MKLTKEAQEIKNAIDSGKLGNITKKQEEFMDNIGCADEFFYCLQNGYIKAELIIANDDLIKLRDAIETVEIFEQLWSEISSAY